MTPDENQFTHLPEWSEADIEKQDFYYSLYREGTCDRLIRYMACKLGVIVHGNINQEELEAYLNQFDVQKLLKEGPYPNKLLSHEAQNLIYDSLQLNRIIDIHLHHFGFDEGNYLNPKRAAFGIAPWMDYFKFIVIKYAAGASSPIGSTLEARKRLHIYAKHFPKLSGYILPVHQAILPDGSVDWGNTGSYLTNRSALITAATFQDTHSELLPAVSIHPFDKKWQEKLTKAHSNGIRLIKWMPPQSIPPDSDLLEEFYRTISKLDMVLIAHSGREHMIPTDEDNKKWEDWGNPLRFRKPLQLGVNVILAHCGHYDKISDLDHPEQPKIPGYHLFLRLADEANQKNQSGEWNGKLFGDLSAVTTHYGPSFVAELLKYANKKGVRFIYGSDYPITNLIIPYRDAYDLCAKAHLLEQNKVKPLKEIRSWNPLLANFIFTKNLELKSPNGESLKFSDQVFNGEFSDAVLKLIDRDAWQKK